MNAQEINQLATIATRYAELNLKSKNAATAITDVKFALFAGFISTEDFLTLAKAKNILSNIAEKTGQTDAMEYINSLTK